MNCPHCLHEIEEPDCATLVTIRGNKQRLLAAYFGIIDEQEIVFVEVETKEEAALQSKPITESVAEQP